MVPGIVVLTCEPCLGFLRTSSGSYRADIPGRMALVGSECAGRRRAVSRVPMSPGRRDTRSELEVALWARPSDWRGRPEAEASAPIGVVDPRGHRADAAPFGPRRDDSTSIIVEGTSLFLDHSGCRMSMSGSVSKG